LNQITFLYKGDEPSSLLLRDALQAFSFSCGVRFWSDLRADDPSFSTQLVDQLGLATAIVHCVGPKGPGFYQRLNEIDRTIDAMKARPDRRLVIVLLGDATKPDDFQRFAEFRDRTEEVKLSGHTPDAMSVLRAAVPGAAKVPDTEVAKFADKVLNVTRFGDPQRCLTIVVGPYAFAEAAEPGSTPTFAIRKFLRDAQLRGLAPWLDVAGSIARATNGDDEDGARAIAKALWPGGAGNDSALGIYLRLLAANWVRYSTGSRLILVSCSADRRVDMALESTGMPIPHVRLVHDHVPVEAERIPQLWAQRLALNGYELQPSGNDWSDDRPLEPSDKVVHIKPFGCVSHAARALMTSEQWRSSAAGGMPLPNGLAGEMNSGALLVLGTGAFTPSLQIVFTTLLHKALRRVSRNSNRFMVHASDVRVADPLHRLEASLLRLPATDDRQRLLDDWLSDTYGLALKQLPLVPLLGWLDKLLNPSPSSVP
jgi:hypothetical protein